MRPCRACAVGVGAHAAPGADVAVAVVGHRVDAGELAEGAPAQVLRPGTRLGGEARAVQAVQAVVAELLGERGAAAGAPALAQVAQQVPVVGQVLPVPGHAESGADGAHATRPAVVGVAALDAVAEGLGGDVAARVHGGDRPVDGARRERAARAGAAHGVLEPFKVSVAVVNVPDAVVGERAAGPACVERLEHPAVLVVGGLGVVRAVAGAGGGGRRVRAAVGVVRVHLAVAGLRVGRPRQVGPSRWRRCRGSTRRWPPASRTAPRSAWSSPRPRAPGSPCARPSAPARRRP